MKWFFDLLKSQIPLFRFKYFFGGQLPIFFMAIMVLFIILGNLTAQANIETIINYLSIFVLAFSAFFLWMYSMSTRLFLNTLPFAFMQSEWYRCLSIFLAVLYFRSNFLRTLCLCTHSSCSNKILKNQIIYQAYFITIFLICLQLKKHIRFAIPKIKLITIGFLTSL